MSANSPRAKRQDASRGLALSLGGLVLVAVLPLLLLAGGVAWLVVQQRQDAMADELTGTTRALQVAVDRALQSTLPALRLLAGAGDNNLTPEALAGFSARAERALRSSPDWLDLMLVDATRQVVVAQGWPGPVPELSPEARAALARLRAAPTSPQFTGVQRMGTQVSRLVLLAPRPSGPDAAAPLVLMVALAPLPLSAVFADQHLPGRWTGAVLDPDLRLAGPSGDAARLLGQPAILTLASRIRASEQGMFMALNQEGQAVYTAFSRSPATGWTVALGLPADEVEASIRGLLRQLALGGGLLMALALLLAALVGRGIVKRRQQHEQALQQSEARLSLALAGAELVTWDWHLPSGVLTCGNDWLAVLGDGPDAVPRHIDDWRDRIHPDDRPRSALALTAHLEGQTPVFAVDYRARRADGRWIWLEVRGKVTSRLPDGSAQRLTGTGLDITQRRAEQLAAEQDHVRLQAILATVREGIHILNTEGLLVEANPAFLAMLGWDASAVGRLHVSDWDPAMTPETLGRGIQGVLHNGNEHFFEATHRRRDGTLLPVELSMSRVLMDGQALICVASRDITQRKRHEAELVNHRQHLEAQVQSRTTELAAARDAAEAANRAKSVFLANMSHELRTPLAGAMGMTELALRRATDPRQIDQLNKSLAAARHLLGVISDVLDISRIEADRLVLQPQDFSLVQLIDEALGLQAPAAAARGLTLRAELAPGLPHLLHGDATRLRQILVNFISNAVKFSDRGEILVRAESTEAPQGAVQGQAGAAVWLKLSVTDQGMGIAPAAQAQLFQPFTQADASSTRRHDGAGLRLVIARRLAELMHGHVGMHSVLGQGSSFWAAVRLAQAGPPKLAPPAAESSRQTLTRLFAGTRLLLAEDNPVNREVATALLAQAGLVVDLAVDGVEAVARAREGGHALILMDVQMPRMNGLEATRALRQLPGLQAVPVLAMTARAFGEDRAQCLAAGMDDHIAKPFEAQTLYATVLAWLQQGRRAGASNAQTEA